MAPRFLALLLILSAPVAGGPRELNEALQRYHQGYPAQAIEMIRPLAASGDVDAQYLLGNIFYSLSRAGVIDSDDDAIAWYRKAAEQRSADASYALGVIFDNRWRRTGNEQQAAEAIAYYRRAVDLGHTRATAPLARLRTQSGLSDQPAIALSDSQGVIPVAGSDSRAPAASNRASNPASIDEQIAGTENADGSAQATSIETEAPSESPDSTDAARAAPDESGGPGLSVAQVATRCEQYTQAGFDIYASTIRGARLSGQASVTAIESDATHPGTYLVRFADNRQMASVSFDLGQVPAAVVASYPKGKPTKLAGIIIDSKTSVSGCSISLRFQPEAS